MGAHFFFCYQNENPQGNMTGFVKFRFIKFGRLTEKAILITKVKCEVQLLTWA